MRSDFQAEPFAEKYPRLIAELEEQLVEGERLSAIVRSRIATIGVEDAR